MKFKVGDTVRFRDEKGEGTVTGIGTGGNVVVKLEGIEFPVPAKSLVKVVLEGHLSFSEPVDVRHIKQDLPEGKRQPRARRSREIFEVDLHIHCLVDNFRGMSNGEMLTIQLGHFQYWMNKAIRENLDKLVFIHGVGNGILKSELRRQLSGYPGVRFEDASYRRYGFGATEVLFR